MSEEKQPALDQLEEAMRSLCAKSGNQVIVDFDVVTAVHVIASLTLATKHPEMPDDMKRNIENFVLRLIGSMQAREPRIGPLLRAGLGGAHRHCGAHRYFAVGEGERAEKFQRMIGTDTVPIRAPMPIAAVLPGKRVEQVYMLAVEALTIEQRAQLVAHLSEQFKQDPEAVARELNLVGCPILADGCTLKICAEAL